MSDTPATPRGPADDSAADEFAADDGYVDVSDELVRPDGSDDSGDSAGSSDSAGSNGSAFDDGFVEDDENFAEDIAIVLGDDDPAPAEVGGFDIDITEGDGPLLEGGDDVDTGSAGGRRAGL